MGHNVIIGGLAIKQDGSEPEKIQETGKTGIGGNDVKTPAPSDPLSFHVGNADITEMKRGHITRGVMGIVGGAYFEEDPSGGENLARQYKGVDKAVVRFSEETVQLMLKAPPERRNTPDMGCSDPSGNSFRQNPALGGRE